MKLVKLILMIPVCVLTLSCSGDDDNNDDNPIAGNSISFDIGGAETGSKEGMAYVVTVDSNDMYMISANDGTSLETQTFSLVFYKSFESDPLGNPAPGTYPIATTAELLDTDGFWVVYTNTQTGVDYGATGASGTLTITSNSNNQLKGSFQFSAESQGNPATTIEVTNGTFSAAID